MFNRHLAVADPLAGNGVEFATEGATLALHATKECKSAEDNDERPGTCRAGFCVPDLDEYHERMIEKNVPCLQEPKELFGTRIAQYRDPDGLAISVSEETRPT